MNFFSDKGVACWTFPATASIALVVATHTQEILHGFPAKSAAGWRLYRAIGMGLFCNTKKRRRSKGQLP